MLGLESVTEKLTGNAQPGACVDVLPRCCHDLSVILFKEKRSKMAARTGMKAIDPNNLTIK